MSLVSYAVTGNSTRRPYWHQLTKKVAQIRSKNEFFHQSSVVYSGASTPQLEAVWWSPRQVHPVDKKIYYQDGGFNEVRVRQPLSEVMPWLLYDVRAAAAE